VPPARMRAIGAAQERFPSRLSLTARSVLVFAIEIQIAGSIPLQIDHGSSDPATPGYPSPASQ
jgi:hypothetical protein